MTAHRDDLAALESRHASLVREVADKARELDQANRLLAEARRKAVLLADCTGGRKLLRTRLMAALAGAAAGAAIGLTVASLMAQRGTDHVHGALQPTSSSATRFIGKSAAHGVVNVIPSQDRGDPELWLNRGLMVDAPGK